MTAHKHNNIFIVAILVVFGLTILYQSGQLTKDPKVETVADNCYSDTLHVITDMDYNPYSFYDGNGQFSGHDVELITLIANRLHMNLDLKFMEYNEGIAAITSGGADVLMTCDYSDNFEGTDRLVKSVPTSTDEFTIYAKHRIASVNELYGKRIAIMENGNVEPQMQKLGLMKYCIKYKDNRTAMQALNDGLADYAVMRQAVGIKLLKELNLKGIKAYISVGLSNMCFDINNSEPELAERINKAIEELNLSGDVDRLKEKWLTTFVKPYTLQEVLLRNKWVVLLFVLLIAFALYGLYRNKQREIEERKENERKLSEQATFNNYFLSTYVSAYYIDFKTLACQIYKRTAKQEEDYPIITNYFESICEYIQKDVHPDDRNALIQKIAPEQMQAILKETPEYTHTYRDITEGMERTYRMQVIRGADEDHAAFGFKDVSEEVAKENEEQRHIALEQNNSRIMALEDNLESLYDVELESGKYTKYVKGDFFRPNVTDKLAREGDFFEDIKGNIDTVIYPEDREKLKEVFKKESICKALSETDRFEFFFRLNIDEKPLWFKIRIVYKDTDRKNVIIGCFNASKEQESRQIEEQNVRIAEEQKRNDLLHEIIHSGKWSFFVNAQDEVIRAEFSEGVLQIINNDLLSEPYAWVSIVHPDDKETALAAFNATIADHSCNTPYDVEYRMADRDGQYHWFHSAGRIVRDDNGNGEFFGVHIDVSDTVMEQQRRLLGTIPISPDILGKANIGLWSFELDEGKAPRMYADETMLGLLGLKHQVPPEDLYHAWYDNIDKDSYNLVNDAVAKMVSGEHAEVQYPWHYPDGRTIIVRCGGVRNNEYTEGIRIEGTHQDVTMTLHYDEEQTKIERMKQSMNMMFSLSEEYDPIIVIEPESGKYDWFLKKPDEIPLNTSMSTHGDDFYKNVDIDAASFVNPEYKEQFLAFFTRENMMKIATTGEAQELENLWLDNSDGKYKWKYSKAVRMIDDTGKPYIVVGIIDFTENKELEAAQEQERQQAQKRLQENFDIIEILASEYTSVYYIDLTTDGLTPYTMNESTESVFGNIFRSGISYSEAFRMYVDQQVLPEDKEMMLNAGSIRNIMKELFGKKTFITTYRDAEGHYSEMKFVKVGSETGKPMAVALGFADKDEELRAKEAADIIRKRNTDIIEILASEYSSVYYIDLTTDELDPYTMNEETESEFGNIFRSGIKYSDAYQMYVNTLVHPEDKAMMLEAGSIFNILKELADKKTFITTYRSDNGGNPHYCEMKFVKVGNEENPRAVALGFADKDDEIRADLQRKAIAARDAAVISGLSDDFGCVVYVNAQTGNEVHYRFDAQLAANIPGWKDITNFNDRISTLARTIMHPDDKAFFLAKDSTQSILETLRKEGVFYHNFKVVVGGEIKYYQEKVVKDESSEDHFIAGFRNVDDTAKRELEYQEKLEIANKSKTDFLFNMSHDIRTPMNAIIGFTDLALKHIDDRQRTIDSLTKIRNSGNHLLELINEVLDMARVEAGKLRSEMKTVDVVETATRLVTICQESAKQRNVNLTFQEKNITHKIVTADELHINQIVMNILGNAIKYTDHGGSVTYTLEECESDAAGYGKYNLIIEDTGIGMSPEFLKRIFDSFSREGNEITSKVQGTGLGMSIVKRLVDYLDGKIDIESQQGKGTKVTVSLYLKLTDASVPTQKVKENVEISLTGKKILLTEDNQLNREIALAILEDKGAIVEQAENGMDAVEHIRENGADYYDYVLMDIQMPLMDGFEATKQIRKLEGTQNLPIIALSANAFEEDRKRAMDAGMNEHVAKPIDLDQLMKALAKFSK